MQAGNDPMTPVPDEPPSINRLDTTAIPSHQRQMPLPLTLAWVFLRIGATAFGGLGATLALVEREMVSKRRLITAAEVTEALTYTKLLPGSTGIQVMAYLGYKLGGWPGSALAATAFILPSAMLMLVLAAGYAAATVLPALGPVAKGLTAAVVGILLATTYRLGKSNISEPMMWAIAIVAFLVGAFLRVSAAWIVIAAGLLGILLLSAPSPKPPATGKSQ
jgi:chromate transporter